MKQQNPENKIKALLYLMHLYFSSKFIVKCRVIDKLKRQPEKL